MKSRSPFPAHPLLGLLACAATFMLSSCGGGARPAIPATGGSAGPTSCAARPSEPPPPLRACSFAAPGTSPGLDDFNDGNLMLRPAEQRVGTWYSFTDGTTGCASLRVEQGDSSKALHFSGGGFSNRGAGFGISLAWSPAKNGLCTYDLSAYSGIRFRARGTGTVRMNLASRASAFQSAGGDCPDSDGCYDQQGRKVALSSEFQVFDIPFCSLTQAGFGSPLGLLDSTQITNLNFLTQTLGNFDVWLDDIEFVPWKEGQSRDCRTTCPADELPLGVSPRPGDTWLDQDGTNVRLSTFEQSTEDCGPVTRRYLSYIPKSLPPASGAPVVIVLHGLGADAESMRSYITQGRFEALADRDGFIVVYGNAAPGSGTVPERPNGGGFRKDSSAQNQVDDFAYLQKIIEDLTSRGVINGQNPRFLAGLSDGGGMTHMAALHDPDRYQGIAELMPYPGPTAPLPPASGGFALRRVLLGYSLTDPAMTVGYAAAQLAPLGSAWAAALGLSAREQEAPRTTALPDLVKEGETYQGALSAALLTRDSHGEQVDYGTSPSGPQVRVIRFDHAGHLWPVTSPDDLVEDIAQFGLRNQDMDMSSVVWEFFRSSL